VTLTYNPILAILSLWWDSQKAANVVRELFLVVQPRTEKFSVPFANGKGTLKIFSNSSQLPACFGAGTAN